MAQPGESQPTEQPELDGFDESEFEPKRKKNQKGKQATTETNGAADGAAADGGDGGVKLLSKKQKEKLKKQQEQELKKKKAQEQKQKQQQSEKPKAKPAPKPAPATTEAKPAPATGATLGGGAAGTALGGGATLGGGGGATLGGAVGTSLGGGATLGGGTALGGGVTLGGGAAVKPEGEGTGAAAKKKKKKKKKPAAAAAAGAAPGETPAAGAAPAETGAKIDAPVPTGETPTPTAAAAATPTAAPETTPAATPAAAPAAAKGAKPAPAKAGAKGAGKAAKPAPGDAARKALAARIQKQKEEERQREIEYQKALKEAEEAARKAEEEEARLKKEQDEKKARKKELKKERAKEQAKLQAEQKRQERLARLGVNVTVAALAEKDAAGGTAAAPPKKKQQSEMYGKRRKGNNQRTGSNTSSNASSTATSPAQQRSPNAAGAKEHDDAPEPENWEQLDWEKAHPNENGSSSSSATSTGSTETSTSEAPKSPEEGSPAVGTSDTTNAAPKKPMTAKERQLKMKQEAGAKPGPTLRSPICCVLGHVDTGKTSLLDKIRKTNVQGGEAGGITQQIGATYFPLKTLKLQTRAAAQIHQKFRIKVPGLLIIDTPGHEAFRNLRSRGSNLCDIAVLVVDLMHGLEPQTIESIKLLKEKNTPFIVALNKVDRIFGWKAVPGAPFQESLKKQAKNCQQEFETRVLETVTGFAEQGLNACLYYENKDFVNWVSLIPTSAVTGEGIPDLLMVLIQLTQSKYQAKIKTKEIFQATVLEVKMIEGLGATIDVILVNGTLHEGERIVVCGMDGAIATNIRALLTPQPLRELRVKSPYLHHKELQAAQGLKIAAQGLERAVAGSSLYVVGPDDDENELKERAQGDLTDLMSKVKKRGVSVQASTLGSLEALLVYLDQCKIPVGAINIGPVHRNDLIRASVNLTKGKRKEFGTILAFDVPVDREIRLEAAKMGVKIFTADIIYHLFDQFTKYVDEIKAAEKKEAEARVVFPCQLSIVPGRVFREKNPIVLGVKIEEGLLRVGTPLAVQKKVSVEDPETGTTRTRKEMRFIGRVVGIQDNHKDVPQAGVDAQVAVSIEGTNFTFGRQFDENDTLYSQISRESIDALRDHFREVLTQNKGMVELIKKLKPMYGVL